MMSVAAPGPSVLGLPVDPRAVSRPAPRGDWVGFWLLVALAFVSGWYAGYLNREVGIPVRPTQAACPPGSISCPVPPPPSIRLDQLRPVPGAPAPWETAVRIRVGSGIGSGAVIRSGAGRSVALTCAHLFRGADGSYARPSAFASPVSVDTFEASADGRLAPLATFAARVLDFDAVRDVGLVIFTPPRPLPASPLARDWSPSPGDPLLSVGCSAGAAPTVWGHRYRGSIGRAGTGYSASVVEPKPVPGRSGGALFTLGAELVGVCNFAEIGGSAGYYAAPGSIRFVLSRNESELVADAKPPDDADGDVMPGQAGHRPKPTPQAPPASILAPDPSGSLHAGSSWISRALGLDPIHLQAGGVLALIAWYFRGRPISWPRPNVAQAVPTAPPPPTPDPWDRVMQALEAAAIADAKAQEAAAKASDRAKVSEEIKAAVARMIRPTPAPTASAALVGA